VTLKNDVSTGNIELKAGSGGSGHNAQGGDGGSVTLTTNSGVNLEANKVELQSGNNGGCSGDGTNCGGKGGAATFHVTGTLTVKGGVIDLEKRGGALTFNVGTLDVTQGDTTLKLTGTGAGDVHIGTINLGNGKTFIVDDTAGGEYSFDKLNVKSQGTSTTKLDGDLDMRASTVTFDLSQVGAGNTLLTVTGDVTFDVSKVSFTHIGTLQLSSNDVITLLKADSSLLDFTGNWNGSGMHELKINGYVFELTTASGEVIGKFISFTPKTTSTSGKDEDNVLLFIPHNDYQGSNNFLNQKNPLDATINPTVEMIHNEAGMELTIIATTPGHDTVYKYQWQMMDGNGNWVDIQDATSDTYYYGDLKAGYYVIRCIVWNGTGGQATSEEVSVESR